MSDASKARGRTRNARSHPRPKSPRQLTLGDALAAIDEALRLEHHPGRPCAACAEMRRLVRKLGRHLDMTANSPNLVWDLLKGRRVMRLHRAR